jgi:tRNA modification GTPase
MRSAADTIAAIATAPGEAGISIVRISGARSLEIADQVFVCKGPPPSQRLAGTFVRGFIRGDEDSKTSAHVDEVILLIYRAPRSYTREDVVEIQGHGGRMSAKRILRAVLSKGAVLAEPGEFTRRAFLNGRIDLVQAEAIADLIAAQSDRAATAAMEQLEGHLTSSFEELYDLLLGAAADLEATLDFGDDEMPVAVSSSIAERLRQAKSKVEQLLATWEEGQLLREGALVVISGAPNAGKSTLMNTLLGVPRAIVADLPGTTRDTIEETVILEGVPIRLVDTAGLRETECAVEREGVRRAQATIKRADLNLHVVDCSQQLSQADQEHLAEVRKDQCIIVLNKTDLGPKLTSRDFEGSSVVPCSLLSGEGFRELHRTIIEKLNLRSSDIPHAVISERHRHIAQNVRNVLNESIAMQDLNRTDCIVLVSQLVRTAIEHLGEVTGRTYTKELLDNVFNRFCIGK